MKKAFSDPSIQNKPHPIPKPEVHLENKTNPSSTKFGGILENMFSWLGVLRADDEYKDEISEYSNYFDDPLWNKQWYAVSI